MEIYLVGGAVRDKMLGLEVKERDWVVVGATPEEMIDQGYKQVGKDFPVFLHPRTHEEYALARTERKTAPGYTGFSFHAAPDVTLEEDLLRRDLTINAMAEDGDGNLIDPFNGAEDLQQGRLNHVSDAFTEDPVRILRVARFAARFGRWGFSVGHATNQLMRTMVESGEVDHLVPERVWQEMLEVLQASTPGRFMEVLRGCGALARVFPEIDALFGVPQPTQHHPEVDCGVHALLVLEQAAKLSEDPEIRFAALIHDLGKAETPSDILPQHIGHEERSVQLVGQLCGRLRPPKSYRDLALLSARYHTHCHRALELRPSTTLKLLEQLDALRRPERFEQFMRVCEADARGRENHEEHDYPQADYLRLALMTAKSIDPRPLAESGLNGQELADKLRQERCEAISNLSKPTDGP